MIDMRRPYHVRNSARFTWIPRAAPIAAYDGARHQSVLAFGASSFVHGDTWLLHTTANGIQDDDCSGNTDKDNDGLTGCDDPDCWSWCDPACPPGTSCPSAPRCGHGICTAPRENQQSARQRL
jgi:hypothetical protein